MPIKGLTDRGLAFPELGQIRKGLPKTENAPGKDLNYFRVTFDERETQAAAKFTEIYGDKPTDITIMLPFDEIDRVWESWLEAYTAGRLVARADGEKFIYLVDTNTGEMLVRDGRDVKMGTTRPYVEGKPVGKDTNKKDVFCKPTGRLKVVIPELQRLAYLTVLTTSIHDIISISGQLEAIRQLNGGRLAGVPLVLKRRPKKISTPDSKDKSKRVRREKWLISIEADPEFVKRMLIEVKRLALPGNGLVLPAPRVQATVDEDVIEFDYDYGDEEAEEIIGQTAPAEPETVDTPPVEDTYQKAMNCIGANDRKLGSYSFDELAKLQAYLGGLDTLNDHQREVLDCAKLLLANAGK